MMGSTTCSMNIEQLYYYLILIAMENFGENENRRVVISGLWLVCCVATINQDDFMTLIVTTCYIIFEDKIYIHFLLLERNHHGRKRS